MAITITDGRMDASATPAICNLSSRGKVLSRIAEQEDPPSEEEVVPFHKHCQKTVCSAYGYNGRGATWDTLYHGGEYDLLNIQNLVSQGSSDNIKWRDYFTRNEDNITQDLRSILELIDLLASKSINPEPKTLTFIQDNNQRKSIRVMGMDNDEEVDISKPPSHKLTFKRGLQTIPPESIDVMGMDADHTVDVEPPTNILSFVHGNSSENVHVAGMGGDKTINILDMVYPVGSIYITVDSTFNPDSTFGGHWDLIGEGRCLWSCNPSDQRVGGDIEAGLPNITGSLSDAKNPDTIEPWTFADDPDLDCTGAIQRIDAINGRWRGLNHQAACYNDPKSGSVPGFTLDASRSSAIYGKSNTVQPPSIGVVLWKRVS